jgi:hypothetical protein
MRIEIVILVLSLIVTGCVSKSKAHLQEQNAFQKGQLQAMAAQQQTQQPVVWFRGLIRHSRIPWSEGLTLARGILAAEYTGTLNPERIRVIRQGQVYPVEVKLLLHGDEDPLLEPGDIVEILR